MGRVFGFISNRPELGARVLHRYTDDLVVNASPDDPVGWGIGLYQSGEVLLRRRPLDERAEIRFDTLVETVQTDVLIGHIRRPTIGALRTENTHPFRYRDWLFAHAGTINGYEQIREQMCAAQPEFLQRNRRGDTDSELFFYLFLSCLHEAGYLQVNLATSEQVTAALRASTQIIDRLAQEKGFKSDNSDVLLTNGEFLVALHRSGNMAHREVKGRHEVEPFLVDALGASARAASLEKARCTVIAGALEALPADWHRTPSPSVITMTRTEAPTVEML